MSKWQYKVVTTIIDLPEFQKLGNEGWELCVAHTDTIRTIWVFKKEVKSERFYTGPR